MAELIPYKKKNVILRLRSGSIAEKWYAGFLGFKEISLPDRDPDVDPFISEPLVNQDARKFYTDSDKSDMRAIRKGIEAEGQSAGDAGESLAEPQIARIGSVNKADLADMLYEMGGDPEGLTKNQLIEEINRLQEQQ